MDEYISLIELSQRISLSKRTLRKLIRRPDNPMPAVQIGNKLIFCWAEIEKWMQNFRVKTVNVNEVVDDLLNEFGKEDK